MFKRFIYNGFGIIKSNKNPFSKWVNELNNLQENRFIGKWHLGNNVAFMDLFRFKEKDFHTNGKLSIKSKTGKQIMYVPFKSAHPCHKSKKCVVGELKRYVWINPEELNF